jgi:hypothetical protein
MSVKVAFRSHPIVQVNFPIPVVTICQDVPNSNTPGVKKNSAAEKTCSHKPDLRPRNQNLRSASESGLVKQRKSLVHEIREDSSQMFLSS